MVFYNDSSQISRAFTPYKDYSSNFINVHHKSVEGLHRSTFEILCTMAFHKFVLPKQKTNSCCRVWFNYNNNNNSNNNSYRIGSTTVPTFRQRSAGPAAGALWLPRYFR